jgi:hypothetical protein
VYKGSSLFLEGRASEFRRLLHYGTQSNTYKYDPLEGTDTIRLLIVDPQLRRTNFGFEVLQCDIIHVQLDWIQSDADELAYTALSYVWSNSGRTFPIRIGQRLLHIGTNLTTALYHLRENAYPAVIWADGVYITQADTNESSSRVSLMSKIYERGKRTIVFLGLESGNTSISAW